MTDDDLATDDVMRMFPVGTRVRASAEHPTPRPGPFALRNLVGTVVGYGGRRRNRLRIHIDGNKNPSKYVCLPRFWEPLPPAATAAADADADHGTTRSSRT